MADLSSSARLCSSPLERRGTEWQFCGAPRRCAAVHWIVVELNGRYVELRATVSGSLGAPRSCVWVTCVIGCIGAACKLLAPLSDGGPDTSGCSFEFCMKSVAVLLFVTGIPLQCVVSHTRPKMSRLLLLGRERDRLESHGPPDWLSFSPFIIVQKIGPKRRLGLRLSLLLQLVFLCPYLCHECVISLQPVFDEYLLHARVGIRAHVNVCCFGQLLLFS